MDATKTKTRVWKRVDESRAGTVDQYIIGFEGQLIGLERYEDGQLSEAVQLPSDFEIPSNFNEVDSLEKAQAAGLLERLSSH